MPSYNQNTTTKYPSIVVIHKNNVFIPKYAHSGSIKPSRLPLALSETDRDTEYHMSASIKTGRRSIHLVVRLLSEIGNYISLHAPLACALK